MKKHRKMIVLILSVLLVITLMPTAAFAEEDENRSIINLTENDVWTTPGGDLCWIPVSGAESYYLSIGDHPFELWDYNSGEFCINDKIDWLIKIGETAKPTDEKYELDFWATNDEGIIAERRWDYYYGSDAEYVKPDVLEFTVEDGIIEKYFDDYYEYSVTVFFGERSETWRAGEGTELYFNVNNMIDFLAEEGEIAPSQTIHHILLQVKKDDVTIAEGELDYEYEVPKIDSLTEDDVWVNQDGTLEWNEISGAEWYSIYVANHDFDLSYSDSGVFNIKDKVDWVITHFGFDKPEDDYYHVEFKAYNDDRRVLAKRVWDYYYVSAAEYIEPDLLELMIDNGRIKADYEGTEYYEVSIYYDEYNCMTWGSEGETLDLDLNDMITLLFQEEYIDPSVTEHRVKVEAYSDEGFILASGETYYEFAKPEIPEISGFTFDEEIGTLSWDYVDRANTYTVHVQNGCEYRDIPEIDLYGFIDNGIHNGDITIPEDGKYTVIVRAQSDNGVTIAEGSYEVEYDPQGGEYNWSLNDDGTLTISGTGPMRKYEDSWPWEDQLGNIKKVVIEPGITSIGEEAFSYCHELTSVNIPDSVISIGDRAFCYCPALTGITLPEGLLSIGEEAFYHNKSMTDIKLPPTLKKVGGGCFGGSGIKSIEVDPSNAYFSSVDGVLFNKDMTLLVSYPGGKDEETYVVPDTVTRILDYAFEGNNSLRKVVFGTGLTSLTNYVLYNIGKINCVQFLGNAPAFAEECFGPLYQCNVFYPANDPTWTEDIRGDYRGTVTWIEGEPASGFIQEEGGKRYYDGFGNYYSDRWLLDDGEWYHFDEDGFMQVGWYEGPLCKYYFDESGHMVTGTRAIDGKSYTFDEFGRLVTDDINQMPLANGYYYVTVPEYNSDWIIIKFLSFGEEYAIDHLGDDYGWFYEGLAPDTQLGWFERGSSGYTKNKGDSYDPNNSVIYRGVTYYIAGGSGDGGPNDRYEYFGDKVSANDVIYTIYQDRIEGDNGKILYPTVQDSEGIWRLPEGELDPTYVVAREGWYKENGYWYFYEKGIMVKSAWRKDSKGWCYLGADGRMVTNDWVKDSKGWCWIGSAGYMIEKTQWIQYDGGWYYIDKGYRVQNKWQKDSKGWCYLGADGRMVTNGFVPDSKGQCYIGSDGYMLEKTQWIEVDGTWYYINKGYMAVNQWQKDGKGWMYLGSDGLPVKNVWKKDSKGWCYLGDDGYMVTNGWAKDSKGWCWIASNGYMPTTTQWVQYEGDWYHITKGYRDENVWKKDSKGWCYLGADGKMVTNGFVPDSKGQCWIGSNGYMVEETRLVEYDGYTYGIKNGYMVVNDIIEYNGAEYYFGEDGHLVGAGG